MPSGSRSRASRARSSSGSRSSPCSASRRGGRVLALAPGWEVFGTSPTVEWGLLIIAYVFFAVTTSGPLPRLVARHRLRHRDVHAAREAPRGPRRPEPRHGVRRHRARPPLPAPAHVRRRAQPLADLRHVVDGRPVRDLPRVPPHRGVEHVHGARQGPPGVRRRLDHGDLRPRCLGAVFGVLATDYWFGAFTPPSMLVAALTSGTALLGIVFFAVVRFRLRGYQRAAALAIPAIRVLMTIVLSSAFVLTVVQVLGGLYGNVPGLAEATRSYLVGPLAIPFWVLRIGLGVLVPLVLLVLPRFRTPTGVLAASILAMLGLFVERVVFVLAGQIAPTTATTRGVVTEGWALRAHLRRGEHHGRRHGLHRPRLHARRAVPRHGRARRPRRVPLRAPTYQPSGRGPLPSTPRRGAPPPGPPEEMSVDHHRRPAGTGSSRFAVLGLGDPGAGVLALKSPRRRGRRGAGEPLARPVPTAAHRADRRPGGHEAARRLPRVPPQRERRRGHAADPGTRAPAGRLVEVHVVPRDRQPRADGARAHGDPRGPVPHVPHEVLAAGDRPPAHGRREPRLPPLPRDDEGPPPVHDGRLAGHDVLALPSRLHREGAAGPAQCPDGATCRSCHTAGRIEPLPADHATRADDTCTACHIVADARAGRPARPRVAEGDVLLLSQGHDRGTMISPSPASPPAESAAP